jgi:hypothetical protein
MPNSTTTQLNQTVKETFDAVIQDSFEDNMTTLKYIKRTVGSEDITSVGRYFAIKVQSNESYGGVAEGGAFPTSGRMVDVQALINYRSQFKSFAFMFGDGTGILGQIDSEATPAITMLNTVAYPMGARGIRAGMVLNAYDVSGSAYRTTGITDMTVQSVARSTDIITMDSAATDIADDDDDVLVFKNHYNLAPLGFKYHVADSGTWLGLSRTTYPNLKSVVHDASSATIDWDMLEIADLKSRNVKGDSSPKFDSLLITHPVNHKNLRASARSGGNLQFNANVAGNAKMDLLVKDVTPGGQRIVEDLDCPPSDLYGIRTDDWALEEVAPRQLYKHNDGSVFIQQIASSTNYGDAKEGRIYWRYNPVCKAPFRQYRIKNINFSAAETRIQRM